MAALGKERVFFIGSLLVTGLLGGMLFFDSWVAPRAPRGKTVDPATWARLNLAKAPRGALRDTDWTRTGRDAFREPKDWSDLPPADVSRPPLRAPSYVPPPPPLKAGLAHLGIYRQPPLVTPHEFAAAPAATTDAPAAGAAAEGASGGNPPVQPSAAPVPVNSASAEVADVQKKFDWLDVAADLKPWYGVILNQEKYTLADRPEEDVIFQRFDPKTGRLLVSGPIVRSRIQANGIHLADNVVNRTELLLLTVPEREWSASSLSRLLDVIERVLPLGRESPYASRRAAEQLAKYAPLDPKVARTWELLADAKAALLDIDGELEVLQQAKAAGAESGGLIERSARWLLRIGARESARSRLRQGVARFPIDRGLRLALGRLLLADGDVEGAIEQFNLAAQQSQTGEERMQVTAELGSALLERGDLERAQREAQSILSIEKEAPLGLRLDGALQFARGRTADALAAFTKFGAAAGSLDAQAEARLAQGLARARQGEFDGARSDFEEVSRINPLEAGPAAAALADLFARTGHLDRATESSRAAVAHAPDDAYHHYLLGLILRRGNDLEDAGVELRRALDLGAVFPDLFNELGFLALLESRGDDGRRYFEESLAREERDETKLLLAHAHLVAGDLLAASRLFAALQNGKLAGEALLGLAYCSYKRGESAAAQTFWQQVKDDLASAHADDKEYAGRWLAVVQDLESKRIWEDPIVWREVGNGWSEDSRYDLEHRIAPGSFRLTGTQRAGTTIDQWTSLKRDVELAQFFEFEVETAIGADHQGRVGFGLVHFLGTAGTQAPQIRTSLVLAMEPDGTLLMQRRENAVGGDWVKVGSVAGFDRAAGEAVRFTLRRKERGSAFFQFFANGSAVGEPVEMNPWRGKVKQPVSPLWFAAVAPGKKCDAELRRARRTEYR